MRDPLLGLGRNELYILEWRGQHLDQKVVCKIEGHCEGCSIHGVQVGDIFKQSGELCSRHEIEIEE